VPKALAIDIGGSKLAVALVDDRGRITKKRLSPTSAGDDPDALFAVLEGLVKDIVDSTYESNPVVAGVGSGGPMLPGGETISPLNIPAWRQGFPLRSRLEELVNIPVFVDNDAKALALGEGWRGAARGRRNFLAMVVSTGVGGGLVIDGRLLDGAAGNAGHIGHVIVEPGGRKCACGGRGCLEALASGPAIEAIHGMAPADAPVEVRRATGRYVGRAVASVANLLDLKLATVAGSVALGFGDDFFIAAQAEVDELARIDYSKGCQIIPAGLGADGPLIGAAAVGWRGLHGDDFLQNR
jgi:glucokinase